MSMVAIMVVQNDAGLTVAALGPGLVICAMATALGPVSGAHFNPAVSLAFLATGRMKAADFAWYVISQVLGAIAGAMVAKMASPGAFDSVRGGITALGSGVSAGTGIFLEVIATIFLVGVIWGTAVSKKAPPLGALFVGLTVILDILAIGPVTGAAMNPARFLGPAVVTGNFSDIAVYLIGPCLGAVIGAFAWEYMLSEKVEDQTDPISS